MRRAGNEAREVWRSVTDAVTDWPALKAFALGLGLPEVDRSDELGQALPQGAWQAVDLVEPER